MRHRPARHRRHGHRRRDPVPRAGGQQRHGAGQLRLGALPARYQHAACRRAWRRRPIACGWCSTPQDPANTAGRDARLAPAQRDRDARNNRCSAGTTCTLALQDASGTTLDTVSYTSQGTDDNIAVGPGGGAQQQSAVLQRSARQASVQDTTTSTPSVVVLQERRDSRRPAASSAPAWSTGSQALYVVPPPRSTRRAAGDGDQPGVRAEQRGLGPADGEHATIPGPMLGADDPCALSSG